MRVQVWWEYTKEKTNNLSFIEFNGYEGKEEGGGRAEQSLRRSIISLIWVLIIKYIIIVTSMVYRIQAYNAND